MYKPIDSKSRWKPVDDGRGTAAARSAAESGGRCSKCIRNRVVHIYGFGSRQVWSRSQWYGRELHSGSLVANHGSRPYATTLICPEICPKNIKYWYRVLKYGFGCLLRSGLISGRSAHAFGLAHILLPDSRISRPESYVTVEVLISNRGLLAGPAFAGPWPFLQANIGLRTGLYWAETQVRGLGQRM